MLSVQAVHHFHRAICFRAVRWWCAWLRHTQDLRLKHHLLSSAHGLRVTRRVVTAWLAYTTERQLRTAEFQRQQLVLQEVRGRWQSLHPVAAPGSRALQAETVLMGFYLDCLPSIDTNGDSS